MADTTKDTVYIDIDDEITAVIEKVRASQHKIVALVLPKRATVFQSIVNLKLLKRAGKDSDKRVVLITSEAVVLPVAGAVGLHVAKTLQSKPVIPAAPKKEADDFAIEDQEEPSSESEDGEIDSSKSIGELAGVGAGVAVAPKEETIDLDDEPDDESAGSSKKSKKKKKKQNKKLAVPNFEKFRTKLFLGIGAFILLILLWLFGSIILPSAKITIKTDTTTVNTNISPTLKTDAKDLDEAGAVVPAKLETVSKTDSEKVTTTGQKDVGNKATGTITAVNCTDSTVTVPAGTTFTNSGLSFTSNVNVSVPGSNFFSNGGCKGDGKASVAVTAMGGGEKYNLSDGRSYTTNFANTLTGTGSAMSGGTTKNITVVSQGDIDNAKAKLNDRSKGAASDDLKKALQKGNLYPVVETLNGAAPAITPAPKVGDEASEVTVTQVVTYTMLGAKEDDLKKLIENDAKKQIDTSKQAISDTGLSQASIRVADRKSDNEQKLSLQTTVTAGAQIDQTALKKEVAGKKKGDIQQLLQGRPGVRDVNIDYSPFWVTKTPSRTSRIRIVLEEAN